MSSPQIGRSMTIRVYGDDAAELELAALDEARQVFGDHAQLQISRDYSIGSTTSEHIYDAEQAKASGKRYLASIRIEVLEEP